MEAGLSIGTERILPPGDEPGWEAAVARLKATHLRLKAALAQLTDQQLLEYPAPDLNRTLLELILSSGSAHEAHHSGAISYLRGPQVA